MIEVGVTVVFFVVGAAAAIVAVKAGGGEAREKVVETAKAMAAEQYYQFISLSRADRYCAADAPHNRIPATLWPHNCRLPLSGIAETQTMPYAYHLVGPVVKAPASRAADLGPSDFNLVNQWLPGQVPGVVGSALGMVGPVSIYCDWVR